MLHGKVSKKIFHADVDLNNNYWPPRTEPTRFQLFKRDEETLENPMQRAERAKKQ